MERNQAEQGKNSRRARTVPVHPHAEHTGRQRPPASHLLPAPEGMNTRSRRRTDPLPLPASAVAAAGRRCRGWMRCRACGAPGMREQPEARGCAVPEENGRYGILPACGARSAPPATAAASPGPRGSCPSRRDGGGSSVSGWNAAQPMRHRLGGTPRAPLSLSVSPRPPSPHAARAGKGRRGREEGGGRRKGWGSSRCRCSRGRTAGAGAGESSDVPVPAGPPCAAPTFALHEASLLLLLLLHPG